MLKETELRIARALEFTETPWWHIAREWNVSLKTVERIASKHGVRRREQRANWSEFGRRPA